MADDDLNKDLEEQQQRLAALRKEVDKLTKTGLSKQQKSLQKLRKEYAEQSKKVLELTKRTKALRIEKTQLTRVMEQLTSKFGGSASAITKFTGGLKDSIFSTDNATGNMKVLGQEISITAGKFAGYAVAIQLAIAATVAFLEWVDKAEIKQGKLQRALGSTGVSIGASMRAQASGYKVAGEAGAKAAEDLANRIAKARRGLFDKFGVGTGGEGFERLTKLTAGMSEQVPQWLTTLTETFAMGAGPKGDDQILTTLEHIGQIANASNVDVDLFGNMIFDLAKEFVALGVDIEDATDAMTVFVDEMGKSTITPAVSMAIARNVFQQQKTAGGLQGRLMTAAFSAQVFDTLGEDVQGMLNTTAAELTGNKQATWQSLDVAQQAESLRTMDPGPYVEIQRGLYGWLKQQGELVAMKTSQQVLGVGWSTAKLFFEKEEAGLAPKDAAEKLRGEQKAGTDKFTTAVDDFNRYVTAAAENQKEFTAGMHEVIETWQAVVAEKVKKVKEGGGSIAEQVIQGAATGILSIGDQSREMILEAIKEKSLMGDIPEDKRQMYAEYAERVKIQRSPLEQLSAWVSGRPKNEQAEGIAEGIAEGTAEVDTPAGKIKVTAEFVGDRLIDENPSKDASGASLRD